MESKLESKVERKVEAAEDEKYSESEDDLMNIVINLGGQTVTPTMLSQSHLD